MSNQEIKKYITNFLKEKGVLKASIFGSFARGDNTEGSDIDLIIQLSGDKNLFDLAEIKVELEEKFHKKVDVLTYSSINPHIKEEILKDQEVLF
ncbi:MAG TPA: nucleotidyltransferase family protein [Ignavibacteria bacterium]|nr:nucleotidyltransferase family protein [Ignavibacteria bacterium]HMQ99782.1 nucleotidyltransferase family protein [Ignavibacteria bacterium]